MARGARKLGRRIGGIENRVSSLEQEAGPTETSANYLLQNQDNIQLRTEHDIIRLNLCDDAFVPDHPTQGELDSSTLKLDKGYCDGEIIVDNISKTLLQTANNEALMSGDGGLITP